MRTLHNLWAIHAPAVENYRRQRSAVDATAIIQALSDEERAARSDRMRGSIKMMTAAEAEKAWYPISVYGPVAIVHVAGVMLKGGLPWWGECCTLEIRRAVEAAVSDPDVDSIVLRMDTPGGSVDALAELGDTVFKARGSKPIIAQVDGLCCSAGYYVASQADEIRSGRMDTIGSIGTRMLLYDWHRLFESEGIEAVPIDTGAYKSTGAQGTEITEDQRAFLRSYVDAFFADFKATITRGRPALVGARLDSIADGRWWSATEAMVLGLVDRLATLDDTLSELVQRLHQNASRRRRVTAEMRTRLEAATAEVRSIDARTRLARVQLERRIHECEQLK